MARKFEINLLEDGVFLVVFPDSSDSLTDVVSAISEKGVKQYNGVLVKSAVEAKTGLPVKIADPQAEEPIEADFRLRVSDDGLTCEMWYIPESGGAAPPTMENVLGFMNSRSVTFGHDEEAIKKMLGTPIHRQWVVTAKGVPPVNGKDASIDYKVDLNVLKPRAVGNNVDMKELGSVINVVMGQEIAVKVPVIQGSDGTTLAGKRIAAYAGKDKNLPAGKGTTMSEDRLHLYAECDGNLYIKEGKLNVNPVFEVKGDVDYSIGNIDFIGPVAVHGAVREGFEVRSGSNITVDGVVEGATLESKGNITISIGVRGTGKAKIRASGDISANYIDQANVRSDSNISISEAIMHSDVGARGEISVMGSKKGQIVGGKVHAGSEIVCEVLGSEMGTKTEVMVGELPEVVEERKRSEENLKQFEDQLQKLDANIDFLKDLQQKGALTNDKQSLLARLTKSKFQLKAQVGATVKKLGELDVLREKNKTGGRVRVKNICHPGVTVTIRGVKYLVRETLRFSRFVYEDGEIKIKSFD
jgi:uncharacterized protein (DUF342 family)